MAIEPTREYDNHVPSDEEQDMLDSARPVEPTVLAAPSTTYIISLNRRGIHLIFWDEPLGSHSESIHQPNNARYAYSMTWYAALQMAHGLQECAMALMNAGVDPNDPVPAPKGWPTDAREKLWPQMYGGSKGPGPMPEQLRRLLEGVRIEDDPEQPPEPPEPAC